MGYSWKGPLETTLSNPLTHGEILRASSPRPCPQHLNTARHGVPTSSLSNLSLCLVILTVKVCFLVFRRSLLCIFVPAASGPVCGYHWTESHFSLHPLLRYLYTLMWSPSLSFVRLSYEEKLSSLSLLTISVWLSPPSQHPSQNGDLVSVHFFSNKTSEILPLGKSLMELALCMEFSSSLSPNSNHF